MADLLADDSLSTDSTSAGLSFEEFAAENPLYAVLYPNVNHQTGQLNPGPVVGVCAVKDTAQVNVYLNDKAIIKLWKSGKSKKAISRNLGHDIKTIRKII